MLVQPQESLNGGSEKAKEKHQKTATEYLPGLEWGRVQSYSRGGRPSDVQHRIGRR